MRSLRLVVALVVAVAALAAFSGAQSPSSRRVSGGNSSASAASQTFDPAASAGLFVGVNEFDRIKWLACCVHDAIDLAYLFSMELELIKPDKIVLALSGEPTRSSSIRKLRELRANNATIVPATKQSIEVSAEWVAKNAGENGLHIFTLNTHGERVGGNDYAAASDSLPNQVNTYVNIDLILDDDPKFRSRAPRRLSFIATCRVFNSQVISIPRPSGVQSRSPWMARGMASARIHEALGKRRGRADFYAAVPGAQAWEMEDGTNSLFAYVVMETLRTGKGAGADGLLLASQLETCVNDALEQKIQGLVNAGFLTAEDVEYPGIQLRSSNGGGNLPLAAVTVPAAQKTPEPTPKPMPIQAPREPRAGDVQTLDLGGGVSMNLVWVPAGTFMMGSPDGEEGRDSDEGPQTRVTLTEGYWMGQSEVTVGQFKRFVAETSHRTTAEKTGKAWALNKTTVKWEETEGVNWRQPGFSQDDSHPVVCVSWDDADAFCKWASGKSKTGRRIELPTEAQWEYACRAGSTKRYAWGDTEAGGQGWCNGADAASKRKFNWAPTFLWDDGYIYTSPAKSFQANNWGLYDMHGNVWEWCADWHGTYPGGSKTNYSGLNTGSGRVCRGGSWGIEPRDLRSADRSGGAPAVAGYDLGFRVAAVPAP